MAARTFGRQTAPSGAGAGKPAGSGKWHLLDGQPQTDALFEHEIVERMGSDFYQPRYEKWCTANGLTMSCTAKP